MSTHEIYEIYADEMHVIKVFMTNLKQIRDYMTIDLQQAYPSFHHAFNHCIQSFNTIVDPSTTIIEPEPIMIIETLGELTFYVEDLIELFYDQLKACRPPGNEMSDDYEFFICDTIDIIREPFWELNIDI